MSDDDEPNWTVRRPGRDERTPERKRAEGLFVIAFLSVVVGLLAAFGPFLLALVGVTAPQGRHEPSFGRELREDLGHAVGEDFMREPSRARWTRFAVGALAGAALGAYVARKDLFPQ
ncbi:MAG: hypothetical protein KF878_32665 [Planctomycetes bacterium]|nr:hypothetical protein [Planctomycetota bacterium]